MPELGETKVGRELDRQPHRGKFVWTTCEDCGKERWVKLLWGKPKFPLCRSCGSLDQGIRGKGYRDKDGYKLIRLSRTDSFFPMTVKSGYVLEHRLVIAKSLGRCLTQDEIVHHLNGVKDDNRLENLVLTTRGQHIHLEEPYKERIVALENRVRRLELVLQGRRIVNLMSV